MKIQLGRYVVIDFDAKTLSDSPNPRGRLDWRKAEPVVEAFERMLELQIHGGHQVGDSCRKCIDGRLAARALMRLPCRSFYDESKYRCDEEVICITCAARCAVILDGRA